MSIFLHMTVYKLGVYYLQIIKFLNLDSPKNENYHNLLNIMSVQACMHFFLLWNIICEIQEMFVHTVEIKSNLNILVKFYKIFFCVQQKKVIQVWNDMKVKKLSPNLLTITFQQFSSKSVLFKCFISRHHYSFH